jgi:hypothetical protein
MKIGRWHPGVNPTVGLKSGQFNRKETLPMVKVQLTAENAELAETFLNKKYRFF